MRDRTAGPFPMGPAISKFNGESRCHRHAWGMDCPPGWRTVDESQCAECARTLYPAAPELLYELEKAHKIIQNALNIMTTEQKNRWGEMNEHDGLKDGWAVTREAARRAVIAKASGEVKP